MLLDSVEGKLQRKQNMISEFIILILTLLYHSKLNFPGRYVCLQCVALVADVCVDGE